ncbi:alpha/beta hydrolase family protein [Candidatus Leptofilum sp.]|uniref:alpha/beta hydrolase family protein n=1 Tax=Candidatus Leptofilum sp. TaxID=3241576 RepID=UPI003B5B4909
MRTFEILLLIVLLFILLWLLFSRKRPHWLLILPGLATLFAALHLAFEGYRWQMIPAYGLTAVFFLLALRWRDATSKPLRLAWLGALLGLLIWLVAVALPVAMPVPFLPDPTGPYAIGTFTTFLVDENRLENYTEDPDDNRELVVQVWYPAANRDGETATYLPDLEIAGPVIAEQFGLPAFLVSHVNLTDLDIWLDVPAAGDAAPYPVIIFSHGLTGIRMQNTTMVRELVSHGYVVAAIEHSYANAITIFPDGRVFVYKPSRIFPSGSSNPVEGNPLVNIWANDIGFLLDTMAVWNDEAGHLLNGRLNLDQVGIFGHSTGGGATMQFCLQDSRCRAGVGLDSWLLPVDDTVMTQGPSQPFMFISAPRWLGPDNQARGQAIFNNLTADGYNLVLDDTQHYDFTDLALLSPLTPQLGLSGSIDSTYSLTIQSKYLLAFFDQYVRERPSDVLTQPSPYPELTIERNLK